LASAAGAIRLSQKSTLSSFVISLDLELFWGVAHSRTVANYRNNIEGEWDAIPRILALFRQYGIQATWATVGMAMCRNYHQWREVRPSVLPRYARTQYSTYLLDPIVREYPRLFFARPLVEEILATPGQELATHTYSHFYCGEEGATPEQFAADLACAQAIASEMGEQCRSLVFPRNQVLGAFLGVLKGNGVQVYRGNQDHWLYRTGDLLPSKAVGRVARFADSWLPISGHCTAFVEKTNGLVNVPASLFLRPWSPRLASLDSLRIARMKRAMTMAARTGGICHVWWHPHNFGINTDANLATLEVLLQHYRTLQQQYGMLSERMGDFSLPVQREAACV
jgi:peptidoglycan/xylan/chitin deacetylase (PgdA/CDA1 family)